MWERVNKLIKDDGAIVFFGQGIFSAKLMLSNEKYHRYNLCWDKQLPSGFLNSNRMPLPVHEDILVFYKKLPTYNPQKFKGTKNNSKGKLLSEYQETNNNYGDLKQVDNRDELGDMKFPKSVLSFQKPHPSVAVHPTQKSTDLLEWLIKTYTDEGQLVLDFTFGSGSCAIACMKTNRKFIGSEFNPEKGKDGNYVDMSKYFDIAVERIQKEMRNGN